MVASDSVKIPSEKKINLLNYLINLPVPRNPEIDYYQIKIRNSKYFETILILLIFVGVHLQETLLVQ